MCIKNIHKIHTTNLPLQSKNTIPKTYQYNSQQQHFKYTILSSFSHKSQIFYSACNINMTVSVQNLPLLSNVGNCTHSSPMQIQIIGNFYGHSECLLQMDFQSTFLIVWEKRDLWYHHVCMQCNVVWCGVAWCNAVWCVMWVVMWSAAV